MKLKLHHLTLRIEGPSLQIDVIQTQQIKQAWNHDYPLVVKQTGYLYV